MRPFQSNAGAIPRQGIRARANTGCDAASEHTGTPAAQAEVARLMERLLPQDRVSRRAFLGWGPATPVVRAVSLKTFVALVVGAWALEQSMDIAASNHKASAADDVSRGRDLATRYGARCAPPKVGEPDVLWRAREISFTRTGTCGRHAARNFVLVGAALRGIHDESPALRTHPPTVEMVSDLRAGARLGGPPSDVHVFVLVKGGDDPIVVDSWVTFAEIVQVSHGLFRADVSLCAYDPSRPASLLPDDVLGQIDEAAEAGWDEPGAGLLSDEHYADPTHWHAADGQRFRQWQLLYPTQRDAPVIYTCGSLTFDPDLMGAEGLAIRKRWIQEANLALEKGGQSPIRDAPAFSPLRRTTQPAVHPSVPPEARPDGD